ncbi:MAG TPA: hypothetical protein VMH80_04480 [Bryobacteraceae bacterium]|nr:hypothetical protein [Bryobacteraceae bacterium]
MTWRAFSVFSLAFVGLSILSGSARADALNFTPIDISGAYDSYAMGINSSGQVVGWFRDSSGTHEFLDLNGSITVIGAPNAISTQAFGVNNLGEIVGSYQTADFELHGFIYDGSTFQTVDVPGAQLTYFYGINDSGVVVGNSDIGVQESFTYDGSFQVISVPGSLFTDAYGINNAGQVTGLYRDPGFNGFVEDNGSYQSFNVPGGFDPQPNAINNNAVVVGSTLSLFAGFIDVGGTFTEVDSQAVPRTTPSESMMQARSWGRSPIPLRSVHIIRRLPHLRLSLRMRSCWRQGFSGW